MRRHFWNESDNKKKLGTDGSDEVMEVMEVTGECATYPLVTAASFCSEAIAGSGCATSDAMTARCK